MYAHCDHIAGLIQNSLIDLDKTTVSPKLVGVSKIHWDLSEQGVLNSTMKSIIVIDHFGKAYRISVEEI